MMMNRDQQIEFMNRARQREDSPLTGWIAKDEVRQILMRDLRNGSDGTTDDFCHVQKSLAVG